MKTKADLLLSLGFQGYKNYGRFLTKQIDRDRFVQLYLEGSGTHQQWDGVRVRIFSKVNGEIGSEAFHFSDHLEKGRSDNPYAKTTTLHVWVAPDGSYEFYLVQPKNPGVLCVLVEDWIDGWRV